MDREQTVSMVIDVFHFYATVIQWRLREVFFFNYCVFGTQFGFRNRRRVGGLGEGGGGGLISVGYSTAGY